jgi:hypothetical protein
MDIIIVIALQSAVSGLPRTGKNRMISQERTTGAQALDLYKLDAPPRGEEG